MLNEVYSETNPLPTDLRVGNVCRMCNLIKQGGYTQRTRVHIKEQLAVENHQ